MSDHDMRNTVKMNNLLDLFARPSLRIDGKAYGIFETRDQAQDFIQEICTKAAERAVDIAQTPPDIIKGNDYEHYMRGDLQVAASLICTRAKKMAKAQAPAFDHQAAQAFKKDYGVIKRAEGSAKKIIVTSDGVQRKI